MEDRLVELSKYRFECSIEALEDSTYGYSYHRKIRMKVL